MDKRLQKYILICDRVGEHLDKGWLTSKSIPTQLLRGDIFVALPESEQPQNPEEIALQAISTPEYSIKLKCPTLEVSKITDSEADLLLAITSREERFRSFKERNRLEKGKSLNVGSNVFVKVKSSTKELPGVIWYKGPLLTHNGTMFGVELLDKESEGCGTCDGTFKNKRYFTCPQDKGIFVALDKLHPRQDQDKSPKKETTLLSTFRDMMPSFSSKDTSAVRNMAKEHKLKINQRAVVFPEGSSPLRGTVRYISEKIDSDGHCPVGIELDERKGSGTGVFEGEQLFVCKPGFALFAPVTTIIPEEEYHPVTERLAKSDGLSASSLSYLEANSGFKRNEDPPKDPAITEVKSLREEIDGEKAVRIRMEQQLNHERHQRERTVTANQELQQRLQTSEQQRNELQAASTLMEQQLNHERQQREIMVTANQELQERLQTSEQQRNELQAASTLMEQQLNRERQQREIMVTANQELEERLQTSEQQRNELQAASTLMEQQLNHERQQRERTVTANQELEERLQTSEQQRNELQAASTLMEQQLNHERQQREIMVTANQELQERLQTSEQQRNELQAVSTLMEQQLNHERQQREIMVTANQELQERLQTSEQQRNELQAASTLMEQQLNRERQQREIMVTANQELEERLQTSEQQRSELQTTLSTAQQALEEYRSARESSDWVLHRDEIVLSDTVIGVGGWGKVMEGTFRGCKVAVKQIHDLILSPHNRRRFEREMSIASRCRHPCLLQFIGATIDDQTLLFVTELLDTSLRAVLHERALDSMEITTIALDVAKGLNYLHLSHPAPIIHRDISSANVLLWKHGTQWRGKVSDYGTANFMQYSMTVSPGAVAYSAPEAQTSRQSPKVDAYSFGVLLCEMNIRELPDTTHRNEQVAMVTDPFYRDLIRRCLQRELERRPDMTQVIALLENQV